MTTFKQGDVLLVPFPFTDQSTTKQRPAVVLSGEAYNLIHPDVILAPVTSQISRRPDEVALSNWPEAGLLNPSVVKPILSSLDVALIRRQLGTLSDTDLQAVRDLFTEVLDLG